MQTKNKLNIHALSGIRSHDRADTMNGRTCIYMNDESSGIWKEPALACYQRIIPKYGRRVATDTGYAHHVGIGTKHFPTANHIPGPRSEPNKWLKQIHTLILDLMQLLRFCDNRYTKFVVNHLACIRSDNAGTEKNAKDEIQRNAIIQSNLRRQK
jgi:hypothetical protein